MPNSPLPQAFDAQLLLDMMQLQLNWLEREITILRQAIRQTEIPNRPRRPFASLRGVWAGVTVSDQDFRAARLTLPEGLT